MLLCDVLLCFSFDSYFTFALSYIIKKALLHCKCVGPKIKTFPPLCAFARLPLSSLPFCIILQKIFYKLIRQAKAIVQDRADIVESAKKEAEAIVKRAEDRARAMVAQEAIVKAAQQKATEILTSAQSQSREMRTTVTNYCENMLRHTEEQLAKSMTEVKTVRSTLRQSGKKATVRPAAQPQKPE